jgi:hypothetical protein
MMESKKVVVKRTGANKKRNFAVQFLKRSVVIDVTLLAQRG